MKGAPWQRDTGKTRTKSNEKRFKSEVKEERRKRVSLSDFTLHGDGTDGMTGVQNRSNSWGKSEIEYINE